MTASAGAGPDEATGLKAIRLTADKERVSDQSEPPVSPDLISTADGSACTACVKTR